MTAPAINQPPRLTVQAFWLAFSKVVATVIGTILPILLVRVLSQSDFGIYKQVFTIAATTVSVSTLGVTVSALYYIPRHPERGAQVALNIVLYNFVAGLIPLIILAAYPEVTRLISSGDALEPYAVPLGLIILLTLISTFLHQIPTALQDVKNSTLIIIGTQLSKALIYAAAALFFPSVASMMTASILNLCLHTAFLFWYLHQKFGRFWTQFDRKFFAEQMGYAVPIGMIGLLAIAKRDIHHYFVAANFSAADYAIYSVGALQVPFAFILFESVSPVMAIRFSALQKQGADKDILRMTAAAINRLAALQFPFAAILLVTGRDLIVLLYTKAYEASANIFMVNLLMMPLTVFLVEPVLRAHKGLRKYVLTVRIVTMAGLVAMLYFSIQQLGMLGAIVASVLVAAVERVALVWRVSQVLGATLKDFVLFADLGKVTALTAGAGLIAYVIRNLIGPDILQFRIAAAIASYLLVYGTGFFMFHLPGSEELHKDRLIGHWRTLLAKIKRTS